MTVSTTEGGGAVQPYEEDFGTIGLEDVGAGDLVIPRINIDHDDAVFVNSLTKETFPALTVVILGLVKQRVMWPAKLEDDSKPRCKSTDNTHGFPNVNESQPKKNQFPWAQSNFEPHHAQPVDLAPGENPLFPDGWSSNGYGVLPCDSCVFAKWGKDEDNKSTPPPCNEQHSYPLLYMVDNGDGDVQWLPALFTVQRSAIKSSRQFINGFAQARQPFFTTYTGLTLSRESRGGNEYAVPIFKKMSPSDRSLWAEYAQQFRGIRELIRRAPRPQEDDTAPASSSNENTAPAAPAPAAPAPAAPPAAAAPPVPPAAPAAPTPPPAAAAPPAPPAPPAAPPQPAAPPPAPPAAAAPPAPPAAPTPPPAPPAPAAEGDDDGLPF